LLRTFGAFDRPLRRRDALLLLVVFGLLVILWSASLAPVEAALGHPLYVGGVPAVTPGFVDAIWHLVMALLLVLPARERKLLVLGPALSLGLDVDHLFGAFLPTPFPRVAHNVFFFALATGFLARTAGRYAGLSALGALLTHVAVDGGGFPFLAPIVTTPFGLPFGVSVFLVGVSAVAFCLAASPLGTLRSPARLLWLAGAITVAGLLLWWAAPGFQSFTTG
jgi:hypothetical protein